jgi:hypothetical protein
VLGGRATGGGAGGGAGVTGGGAAGNTGAGTVVVGVEIGVTGAGAVVPLDGVAAATKLGGSDPPLQDDSMIAASVAARIFRF